MKKEINEILKINKEIKNTKELIFEKENDILSCIKSVEEKGIRQRQKAAAVSLLSLKKEKEEKENQLRELCKSLDIDSFNKKKLSTKMISNLISKGVTKENLNTLKEIFQNV